MSIGAVGGALVSRFLTRRERKEDRGPDVQAPRPASAQDDAPAAAPATSTLEDVWPIIREMPSPVVILATDGRVRTLNASATPLDLPDTVTAEGAVLSEFWKGSDLEHWAAPLTELASKAAASGGPAEHVHSGGAAGEPGGTSLLALPTTWKGENVILACVSAHDDAAPPTASPTDLRQKGGFEAVGRLVQGVSHRLINNLTSVLGYLEVIAADSTGSGEAVRADVVEALHAAEEANRFVRHLRGFSSSDTLQARNVDLSPLLRQLVPTFKALTREDVALDLRIVPGEMPASIDPQALEQILFHLVVNAVEAIDGAGEVTIELRNANATPLAGNTDTSSWQIISVRDTGRGMDSATRARVFEPFFTTKGGDDHLGLGLPTTYKLVQASGGRINVISKEDQGTTVQIMLPATSLATASAPRVGVNSDLTGTETILVVDDDPSVNRLMRRALEKSGYLVLSAETPREAIRLAANFSHPIHLFLIDIGLPEMEGPELFDHLHQTRPHAPVLYVTAYSPRDIERETVLKAPGVAGYVEKPFRRQTLLATVRQALG
ncbi:MAG: response regulator [Gemmatimonadota bacterium]|nr:response regulator [Gemmatimonadota bacterium]MDH5760455.1 response regulator [Gemmatimonadota bacterium]